jgi:hypothetical protein
MMALFAPTPEEAIQSVATLAKTEVEAIVVAKVVHMFRRVMAKTERPERVAIPKKESQVREGNRQ